MKQNEIKKVESVEEFRNTLLKLFFSNQTTREVYVKLGKNKWGDVCKYVSVDELNSFEDILNLSDNRDVLLTCKYVGKYFHDKNYQNEIICKSYLERVMLISDEYSFLYCLDNPDWIEITNCNIMFLIDSFFNKEFHPVSK
jgi:hypothetical protein